MDLSSPIFTVHLIIVDVIAPVKFGGEEYKLWGFSLRNLFHPPDTSPLDRNILFSTLLSNTLNLGVCF
jgi:hypothetical protein